jgi:hypothetical protein
MIIGNNDGRASNAGGVGRLSREGEFRRVEDATRPTSQDAKVDLKPLIVAVIPIYCFSEIINLFFFLFLYVFNKLIIFSAS